MKSRIPRQATGPDLARLIHPVREQRVILDADLAAIYGVETRVLNQAVKRNADRFPPAFAFQLTREEAAAAVALRSQFVILKPGRGRHRKYPPYAFTEHGALMAATVLNSPRAVKMSVFIIQTFVRMREEQAANSAILKRLAEIDKTLLIHDTALRDVYEKLRPLLQPPALPAKPEIGFHVRETPLPYRIQRGRDR